MATGTFHVSRRLQTELIYHVQAKENHHTISICPHDDRETEICFPFLPSSLPCSSMFPAGTGKDLWRYPAHPHSQDRTSHRIKQPRPGLEIFHGGKVYNLSAQPSPQTVVFNLNFPFHFFVRKINIYKMKETNL